MLNKIAGQTSLSEMISRTIHGAKEKVAAAEEASKKDDKKTPFPPKAKAEAKAPEKEEKEKKSSAFGDVEKLAAALDMVGDQLIKTASGDIGGESRQGGELLDTQAPNSGRQVARKDGSKRLSVPMSTGLQSSSDNAGSTQVPNDAARAPGGTGAKYPTGGVLKTAADSVMERIRNKAGKKDEPETKKEEAKEKKSSVDFILAKIAESAQGGMTLDSASGQGGTPPSDSKGGNEARRALESNSAATSMKKVDGKAPQKRMLSEVLTEPAMSSATDKTVADNLRNASKGGVKIAAATALLQKIASDPSHPAHGRLKEQMAKIAAEKKEKMSMGNCATPSPMPKGTSLPLSGGM